MATLTFAVGEAIRDKAPLQDGRDHVAERMVHDTVSKWRGGNKARLRVLDRNFDITTRAP